METLDSTRAKIAEMDQLFCERLATVGMYKTTKLMETLKNSVKEYQRTKKITIINEFLTSLERCTLKDITNYEENDRNKENNESIRPHRKAKQRSKSITEQDNKQHLKLNVLPAELGTLDEDTVYYDASIGIKTENAEMPPPALPGRRGVVKKEKVSGIKERRQPARTKKKKIDIISRDSDVIFQPNEIVVVNLDSDEENNKTDELNCLNQTKQLKTTTEANKSEGIATITNTTFAVEKATSSVRKESSSSVYEDAVEQVQSVSKVKKQAKNGPKPLFNPFENSPVKKKVEAFERLGAEIATTTRMTRTKTRNKAKEQQDSENTFKTSTPSTSNRYLPNNPSYSTSKLTKTSTLTTPTAKTMSALKLSQQEYFERQQRHKEKEEEARRKKEQLLKAQVEERKRKREEKELKAKQLREAQEMEKRKMLELQAQKEEKLKRQQAEKLRTREDAEKKRLLAKQKREEAKRMEEEQRKTDEERRKKEEAQWIKQEEERMQKMAEKRRQEEIEKRLLNKEVPLYMTMKAPYLPTYDCYDSDDEEGQKKMASAVKPDFIRSEHMKLALSCMEYVDSKLKNTLFCLKPQTPDLREIFETIDPKKLRRNSSAIWKHAPRFTLMPTFSNCDSDNESC